MKKKPKPTQSLKGLKWGVFFAEIFKFFQVILRVEDTSSRPEKTKQGTSDREKLKKKLFFSKKKKKPRTPTNPFKLCVGFWYFFSHCNFEAIYRVTRLSYDIFEPRFEKFRLFPTFSVALNFFCGHFTLVSEKKEDPQQAQ